MESVFDCHPWRDDGPAFMDGFARYRLKTMVNAVTVTMPEIEAEVAAAEKDEDNDDDNNNNDDNNDDNNDSEGDSKSSEDEDDDGLTCDSASDDDNVDHSGPVESMSWGKLFCYQWGR